MRKEDPVRYSSAVGEAWQHAMFKTKYCHKVFDFKEVREECDRLFDEASQRYEIPTEVRDSIQSCPYEIGYWYVLSSGSSKEAKRLCC